jgi:PBP1b-binding outer membrane lipoprotein LpoB
MMPMLTLAALALQGCAHSAAERHVDQEVAQETAVKSRSDIGAEAGALIQTAPGLSDDQRARLSAVRASTHAQLDELGAQSLKLRALLVKDLISTDYNEDEVELIKKRIKKLENKRLSVIFGAVEQTNSILGREAAANRRMMDEIFQARVVD